MLHDWFGVQLTFSPAGVVLAQAFVALPFLVITVEAGLRSLDHRYEDVAATLGAGRAYVLRRVTLPLLAPSLTAGLVLALGRGPSASSAPPSRFAGNIEGRTRTLPLAVFLALETEPDLAVALGLVLLALSLVVLVALRDRWLSFR
ncbi:MAG: ABC transporter permease subunit [Acidimicrobiia bacterium]|nr:ABC transporter permease subunit [Acidimicrobiia bacterium]